MGLANGDRNQDRLKAAVGVAAFHGLLGYAFITGLAVDFPREVADDLKIFDVPEAPPPPPVEKPVPERVKVEAPEGAASPPSLTAKATPLVAPPPKVQLDLPPPPVVTSPKPAPALGNDRSTGASEIDGPATGSGGEGAGTGSGGRGSGTGGGIAERAKRVSGSISGATDYPRAARRAGIEGSVSVRFTVGIDGTVSGCRVTRSSANDELEATTCRLIERRFRYEPARNAEGRPVPEVVSRTFDWLLPFRN
jgi:protein TonB